MSLLRSDLVHEQLYRQGVSLVKTAAGKPQTVTAMSGQLVLSASGWLLLTVPNALVRGVFDSLAEAGIELPPGTNGGFNAHISVAREEELARIGGGAKITERGQIFHYQIGKLQTVVPVGWKEMSRCWMLDVSSPELMKLRKSYGLPPLPVKNGEQFRFHITVAVRRKKVLQDNSVSKTSEDAVYANRIAEEDFLKWYLARARKLGLNSDPDDPAHFYDYRAAYHAGDEPDETGHWPSVHKRVGHPNLVIDGVDTRTGLPGKTAADLPYRERVEMYATNPAGEVLGGRYENDGNHGVFGGGVDEGEAPEVAGARELLEESGYTVNDPRMLGVDAEIAEWGPPSPDDPPHLAERKKQFRGSRTSFATGTLADGEPAEASDPSGLQDIRLRPLSTAIGMIDVDKAQHPTVARKRLIALQLLQSMQQKQSSFTNRALTAQLNSPSWNPQNGILGNLTANAQQAHQRGQRMISDSHAARTYEESLKPALGYERLRKIFAGEADEVVKDPVDKLLFRSTV